MERETPIILNQNQISLQSTEWKEKVNYIKSHCGDVCVIFSFLTDTGVKQKLRKKLIQERQNKKKSEN